MVAARHSAFKLANESSLSVTRTAPIIIRYHRNHWSVAENEASFREGLVEILISLSVKQSCVKSVITASAFSFFHSARVINKIKLLIKYRRMPGEARIIFMLGRERRQVQNKCVEGRTKIKTREERQRRKKRFESFTESFASDNVKYVAY